MEEDSEVPPTSTETSSAGIRASRPESVSLAVIALALAAVVLTAFPLVVTGERSFLHLDLFYEFTPVWHAAQRALLAGESPFWQAGQYCGHPLQFTQEVPLFYPLTSLLLLSGLPVHRLTDAFTLLHFWIAGVSAFLLVRDLTARHVGASLFAAMGWMLSARTLQSSIWPSSVATMALLPLCVLGLWRLGRPESRTSGAGFLAIAGGLSILTWRVQSLWGSVPLLATIAVATILRSRDRARTVAVLVVASLLGVGIGAPSLLTSAAVYPQTSRADGLDPGARDFGALSEGRQIDQVFLPRDGLKRWPEAAAYPGVLVYLLVAVTLALAIRRSEEVDRNALAALAVAGAVSLVLAFGEAGPYRLLADIPLVRGLRVPVRFLVGWSFFLAIGSSLAIPALERRFGRFGQVASALAIAVLASDLVLHARRSAPVVSGEVYRVEPRLVEHLRRLPPDESGLSPRYLTLAPGLPLPAITEASRAEAVAALEPLAHARGMLYGLRGASGGGPALARSDALLAAGTIRAARLAGAHRLVLSKPGSSLPADVGAPPGLFVHLVPDPLPSAFVAQRAVRASAAGSLEVALRGEFDLRETVVVEEPVALPNGERWKRDEATARFLKVNGGRLEIATRSPGPAVLVVLESWERGWSARVDGREQPVLRANGAFLGVPVGQGAHRVTLVYRPPLLREGVLVALASALGLVFFALRARRTRPESYSRLAPRRAPV